MIMPQDFQGFYRLFCDEMDVRRLPRRRAAKAGRVHHDQNLFLAWQRRLSPNWKKAQVSSSIWRIATRRRLVAMRRPGAQSLVLLRADT